jgi:hypothetical protein
LGRRGHPFIGSGTANADEIVIGGKTCRLIAIEDLVTAKEAVGRDKDILAAKELRAIAAKRAQAKKKRRPVGRR